MVKNSFDICLLYYDNPLLLKNWLNRIFYYSDYFKYSNNRSKIIIADSGTPLDKLEESLKVYTRFKTEVSYYHKIDIIYLRVETEEIRKKVPKHISARPASHTFNVACLDYSKADIIYVSVIGHIYSPKYFERTLAIHLQDNRAVVLPQRFDLDYKEYHEIGYNDKWEDIVTKHKLINSGGWPDMSVRRKYLEEIGGWDENYITISPIDMDLASRLGNFLDDGTKSNRLFTSKPEFINLGLTLYKPFDINTIISLTCNQYKNHIDTNDSKRQIGYNLGIQYYLEHWGEIHRNINRQPLQYREY